MKILKNIDTSIIHMALASFFFFLMSITVKSLKDLPTSQAIFFRAWIAAFLCYIFLKKDNIPLWGHNKKMLVLRGIFGTVALILTFTSIQKLPLATAVVLQNLAPIFTTILAATFLREQIAFRQWIYFLLCFIGVVIIQGFKLSDQSFYIFIAIIASIFSASAYTCIGKINTSEHPLVIMFYFPLITIPVVLPSVITEWKTPTMTQWVLLFLVGIFVQIAQYFMTLSYQHGKNSKVAIINYASVIYSMIGGFLIFGEGLSINYFIGAALIMFGIIANTLYKKPKALN